MLIHKLIIHNISLIYAYSKYIQVYSKYIQVYSKSIEVYIKSTKIYLTLFDISTKYRKYTF